MYRRGLLSTFAIGGLAGCNVPGSGNGNGTPSEPEDDPEGDPDPDPEDEPDDRAQIVDHELVRRDTGTDDETVTIEGAVRIEAEGLQHVELRGRFFGEGDEVLDTTFERLRELEVGTQPFEIRYPEMGPAAAAIDGYDVAITTVV